MNSAYIEYGPNPPRPCAVHILNDDRNACLPVTTPPVLVIDESPEQCHGRGLLLTRRGP